MYSLLLVDILFSQGVDFYLVHLLQLLISLGGNYVHFVYLKFLDFHKISINFWQIGKSQ